MYGERLRRPCSLSKAGRDQKFLCLPSSQYQSFDDANPFPRECPPADFSQDSIDGPEDPRLYDGTSDAAAQRSAIQQERDLLESKGSGVVSLPGLRGQRAAKQSRGRASEGQAMRNNNGLEDDARGTGLAGLEEDEESEFEVTSPPGSRAGELPAVKV